MKTIAIIITLIVTAGAVGQVKPTVEFGDGTDFIRRYTFAEGYRVNVGVTADRMVEFGGGGAWHGMFQCKRTRWDNRSVELWGVNLQNCRSDSGAVLAANLQGKPAWLTAQFLYESCRESLWKESVDIDGSDYTVVMTIGNRDFVKIASGSATVYGTSGEVFKWGHGEETKCFTIFMTFAKNRWGAKEVDCTVSTTPYPRIKVCRHPGKGQTVPMVAWTSVIRSFKHSGLRWLWERGDPSRLHPDHLPRIRRALQLLASATHPADLRGVQRAKPLSIGPWAGHWSLRVSANWRLVFRFKNNEAHDVDLVDYHGKRRRR